MVIQAEHDHRNILENDKIDTQQQENSELAQRRVFLTPPSGNATVEVC